MVEVGGATYPVRIDPTFSDANWMGLDLAGVRETFTRLWWMVREISTWAASSPWRAAHGHQHRQMEWEQLVGAGSGV